MNRSEFKTNKSSLRFVKHLTMMLMNWTYSQQSPFRSKKKLLIFNSIMRIKMQFKLGCKDTQKEARTRPINQTVSIMKKQAKNIISQRRNHWAFNLKGNCILKGKIYKNKSAFNKDPKIPTPISRLYSQWPQSKRH